MDPAQSRRKVFCTFAPPANVRDILERRCDLRLRRTGSDGALADEIGDADTAFVLITDDLSAPAVAALPPSVRAIATYSVGYDHINLEAAAARGIAVLHTPNVLSTSVAENAMFLILGVARRAGEAVPLIQSGAWRGWTPTQLIGFELKGKTLGVLGFGRIGREVAHRAAAFGMAITYHDLQPSKDPEAQTYRFESSLEGFLAGLDILLLAAPSTPETRHILGERTIHQMRPGASVINIARGDLVDDDALIAALQSGRLWGAGLDVFNNEPHLDARYRELPNVFLLPHVGSSTEEARAAMAEILLDGLDALRRGERPPNQLV